MAAAAVTGGGGPGGGPGGGGPGAGGQGAAGGGGPGGGGQGAAGGAGKLPCQCSASASAQIGFAVAAIDFGNRPFASAFAPPKRLPCQCSASAFDFAVAATQIGLPTFGESFALATIDFGRRPFQGGGPSPRLPTVTFGPRLPLPLTRPGEGIAFDGTRHAHDLPVRVA